MSDNTQKAIELLEAIPTKYALGTGLEIAFRKALAFLRAEQSEANALRQALSDLVAEQNGPPLIRDKERWQAAMDKASELLSCRPKQERQYTDEYHPPHCDCRKCEAEKPAEVEELISDLESEALRIGANGYGVAEEFMQRAADKLREPWKWCGESCSPAKPAEGDVGELVAWLKEHGNHVTGADNCLDAAEMLERQEAENDQIREHLDEIIRGNAECPNCPKLRHEVERLRTLAERYKPAIRKEDMCEERAVPRELTKEYKIEQLQAENAKQAEELERLKKKQL